MRCTMKMEEHSRQKEQQIQRYGAEVNKLQPQDQIQPPPAFINKVLLAHSHAHSCTYCLWKLLDFA